MPGTRVWRICSRFLRAETFDLFLAPAIADLQFESVTRTGLLRNYVGVWRAFQGALWWDANRIMHRCTTDQRLQDESRSMLAAIGVFASYLAASTLFFSDMAAGGRRLSQSAVLWNPSLRTVAASAVAVLLFVIVCWIGARVTSRLRSTSLCNGGCASKALIAIWLFASILGLGFGATDAAAQTAGIPARMVSVEGRPMRIWIAGLEQRKPGQPVVILETGATNPGTFPLDTWKPVFPEIARIAPVLAYERRGNGMSEADTERPTMRRVARVLHALLQETRIAPPYVLVGHSWGGNYIRAFFDQYPNEVVGLVFIDADTGMGPTREQKAAVVPPDRRAETLAPPVLPPIPADTPAGLRAEFEEIGKEMISDGAESRTLRPVTGLPVAVIMATPPGRVRGISGAITRLMIQHNLELALQSPNGILVTTNVGHAVHEHEPTLVARAIQHVLDHPPTSTK